MCLLQSAAQSVCIAMLLCCTQTHRPIAANTWLHVIDTITGWCIKQCCHQSQAHYQSCSVWAMPLCYAIMTAHGVTMSSRSSHTVQPGDLSCSGVANSAETSVLCLKTASTSAGHLTKAALAKAAHDLKAVPNMVPQHHAVIPMLIVIPDAQHDTS